MTVIYGGQSWVSAISQGQFHEVRGNSGHTEVHVSYRRNYIDLSTKSARSWRTNKVHSNLSVKHTNLGCFIETWSEGRNWKAKIIKTRRGIFKPYGCMLCC